MDFLKKYIKKHHVGKTGDLAINQKIELVENENYHIEIESIIPASDRKIIRCIVRFPFSDESNLRIYAKDKEGKLLSDKCIFMGKDVVLNKVNGVFVFKEIIFSLILKNEVFGCAITLSLKNEDSGKVIYEQVFEGDQINSLEESKKSLLYLSPMNDPYYAEWFFKKHKASSLELSMQRKAKLKISPKFSIVVCLYETPQNQLLELLDSIEDQTYSNWELILVNASPKNQQIKEILDLRCERDSQIKQVILPENRGITLNTATGIDSSTGDFVCFVDHDDVIEPNCLFEYATRINENPDAEVLYCDEDKIYPDGHFGHAFFKPDFSLHFLRSNNYICHMLAIKRSLLKQLDYSDEAYDGAQDHHLTLQAVEKTDQIEHISKVLYHWRITEKSASSATDAKPYALDAGRKAVQAHLDRIGVKAKASVHPQIDYMTRVAYDVPELNPKVSIIIPNKDAVELLSKCIDSIYEKTTYSDFEVIIVENNSENNETFKYYETLCQKKNLKVVNFEGGFNFSKIVNFGRNHSNGEYLVLLNNDTEVITPNWIENMLGICCQKEVGIVGCKLLLPDETIQHAGVFIGFFPYHLFHQLPNGEMSYYNMAYIQRELNAVTAACLMVSAKTFDEIGGFNEDMEVAYNDVDFCLKVRQRGKLVIYTPFTELYHYESISRGYNRDASSQARLIRERARIWSDWSMVFAKPDPYHTPHVRQGWEGSYYSF